MPDGDTLRTRLSTKGQMILPKVIRDRHGWSAGTVLEIEDGPDGVILKPVKSAPAFAPTRLADVAGMLAPYYSGPPKTIEEMNAGIEEEVLRRHARGRY
jgi:AbrB family looped-hinge helix DNA binding protein